MPIDPRIAMGFQPTTQLESPLNRLAKFQQLESGQRANELAKMQAQEYERGLKEQEDFRNMLAGADVSTPAGRSKLLSAGKPGVEYVKGLEAVEQGRTTQAKNQQDLIKAAFQNSASALAQVNSFSDAEKYINSIYADPVIGDFLRSKGASPESAQKKLMKIATGPDPEAQFNQWKFENAAGIEAAQKQFGTQVMNTAGGVLQYDPRTGATKMIPGTSPADRPMTQAEIERNAIAREGLDFQKKKFAETQQRLTSATKGLTEEEQTAINIGVQEGRVDPNKINGRTAKVIAGMLMSNPDINLLELGVSAAGATAAERSLSAQTAKMSTAANEAGKMVDVVRDLSAKVNRTEYPTINSIVNAVNKGTGGKEIVQLNTSINALVNSYARAISPTGQPTVSDKNHAREIINSAYSKGQIGAILDVMQQEMDIARHAAGTASSELKSMRETQRGRPPAETKPSTAEPRNRPSLDDIFGVKRP